MEVIRFNSALHKCCKVVLLHMVLEILFFIKLLRTQILIFQVILIFTDFLILVLTGSMHTMELVSQPVQFFHLVRIQIIIALITQYQNRLYIIQHYQFPLMHMALI